MNWTLSLKSETLHQQAKRDSEESKNNYNLKFKIN